MQNPQYHQVGRKRGKKDDREALSLNNQNNLALTLAKSQYKTHITIIVTTKSKVPQKMDSHAAKPNQRNSSISEPQQLSIRDPPPTPLSAIQTHSKCWSQVDKSESSLNHEAKSMHLSQKISNDSCERDYSILRLQSKLSGLEDQLVNEKKKNHKFRKIISTKAEKQRQLEIAYKGIVKQLKRQINMNPLCFCKNKTMADKPGQEYPVEKYEQLQNQIEYLKEENVSLKIALEQIRHRFYILKKGSEKSLQEEGGNQNENLRLKNAVLLEQKQSLRKELQTMKKQLYEWSPPPFFANEKQTSPIKKHVSSGSPQRKMLTSNKSETNKIKMRPSDSNIRKQIEQAEQMLRSKGLEDNLFKDFQLQAKRQSEKQYAENVQKISYESKKPVKEIQRQRQSQCSFRTAQQKEEFTSFYSIYESGDSRLPRASSNILDGIDVSSVGPLEESDRSNVNEEDMQLRHFCKQGNQAEKQMFTKSLKTFANFIEVLDDKLNTFLSSYKLKVSFQDLYSMFQKIENANHIQTLKKCFLTHAQLKSIADDVFVTLGKVKLAQSKQQQKKQNNLALQVSELQSKCKQAQLQKLNLQKKIESLIDYNKKLQFDITELSYSMSNYEVASPRINQRNSLLRQIYKNKTRLAEPVAVDCQTQCYIIQHGKYLQYQKFVLDIPKFVNEILEEKIKATISSQIYQFGDLQQEFKKVVGNAFALIQKHYNQSMLPYVNRKKSFSRLDNKSQKQNSEPRSPQIIPKTSIQSLQPEKAQLLEPIELQKFQIDEEAYYEIQAENQQLQNMLKEKNQIILQLKERLAIQKYDLQALKEERKSCTPVKGSNLSIEPEPSFKKGKRSFTSHIEKVDQSSDGDEEAEFVECDQVKQFNNLKNERDEQLKKLRQKVQMLQRQLDRRKGGQKKNRPHYLNY